MKKILESILALTLSVGLLQAQDTKYIMKAGIVVYQRATADIDNVKFYPPNTNLLNLAIGDTHQGGIIFYLDGNGGGLVAAPSDQSAGAEWGCYGTTIGVFDTAIGSGNANTIAIENGCSTPGIAADTCANLTLNGYSDWFLPSQSELNLMYQNIGQGNALGFGNVGGFASDGYWSSTEFYNFDGAWFQDFFDGYQYGYPKNDSYHVRAVRAFQDLTTTVAMLEQQEGTIQLYPNPVVDVLNIQQPNKGNQACIIEILTIDGRLVYKENQNPYKNATKINVSTLPQGIYLCKFNQGITTSITKFIKQ